MGLVDPMRPTADLDGEGLSYGVERRSRGKEESKFAEIAKVTESTYTDSDVSSGNTYLYRVFAKNEFGTGIGSNVVPVRYIKIEAPTGPTKLTAEAIVE
jgi:fibronectin type 3 domain-containing protein